MHHIRAIARLTRCLPNAGPPCETPARHRANIGYTCSVCWSAALSNLKVLIASTWWLTVSRDNPLCISTTWAQCWHTVSDGGPALSPRCECPYYVEGWYVIQSTWTCHTAGIDDIIWISEFMMPLCVYCTATTHKSSCYSPWRCQISAPHKLIG